MPVDIDKVNRSFSDCYEALDHSWKCFADKSLTDEQRRRAGEYICKMSLPCWLFEFNQGNRS
jgi:hypothetical protein